MTEQVLGHGQQFLQVRLDPQLRLQGEVGQEHAYGGAHALVHYGDVVTGELTAVFPATFSHHSEEEKEEEGGGQSHLLTRQTSRATQGAESTRVPPFCSTELSLSSHKKRSKYLQ